MKGGTVADFDDELRRLAADPAFATRVRAAYSGRNALDDVVWWARHPLEPGPSGAPAPGAEREALARQVYARAAAPDDAEQRLVEADAAIASDREALSHALAAAVAAAPVERDGAIAADATAASVPPSRRRTPIAVLVVAVALVPFVGAGGGYFVGRASAPQPVASRPATASALAVFDRPATADDAPVAGAVTSSVPSFLPESYRKLQEVPAPDSPLGNDSVAAVVYAARSHDGRACLLVESSEEVAAVACVTDADFPAGGLQIYWQQGKLQLTTTWAANGEIQSGTVTAGSSKDSVG